jgi:peroxiredoxin
MKYFSTIYLIFVVVIFANYFLVASIIAQTTQPTPTFEEYAANFDAKLRESKIERELNEEIAKLEEFIKQHPEQADYYRQQIVQNLIWLKAPTNRILQTTGVGFANPKKGLYSRIAVVLAGRGEQLETALKFLEMESKVIYVYKANDAYSPPCLWCIESEIRFKQTDYQRVIEILEPITQKSSPQLRWIEGYSPPNLQILGKSYFKVGRVDDAIKIFLKLVSETYEPNLKDREILVKIYVAKYSNLKGLNDTVLESHQRWKYENSIKPFLLNIQSPAWKLPDVLGNSTSFSKFAGKIIVLRFFTSQVRGKENREYMQAMVNLYEKYKSKGVLVVGVDESYPHPINIRQQSLKEAFDGIKISFPIFLDNRREVAMQYGLSEQMTILIDKKGKIRFNTADLPSFVRQLDYFLSYPSEF